MDASPQLSVDGCSMRRAWAGPSNASQGTQRQPARLRDNSPICGRSNVGGSTQGPRMGPAELETLLSSVHDESGQPQRDAGQTGEEPMKFPPAVNKSKVGTYPALTKAGGGYVWDEVLEYRVWCHPEDGTDDYFYAFATFEEAAELSRHTKGAEEPLALILQKEYIDEPSPGKYRHVRRRRITEW